ncbi:hypothetical protein WJX74_004064 [Apatococcus lobatus]|uniref:Uncharacterized protein n=2 Tax=Apatococcus TaxID=904362 RepID=A0AAW1T352_9CHLO
MVSLRSTCRTMRELVDGCTHGAWARAAKNLLRPAAILANPATGASWQDAIRREWQAQRPLHNAQVQRKVAVKAWKRGASFWVSGAGDDTRHSYLLSRVPAGVLWLFNACSECSGPVQLALRACRFRAFVRKDGRLCIVQALGASQPAPLVWHIVNPHTGETLSSVRKLTWTLGSWSMSHMRHGSSHQVQALKTGFVMGCRHVVHYSG